jgi:uncharacterized protein (DUF983 family)
MQFGQLFLIVWHNRIIVWGRSRGKRARETIMTAETHQVSLAQAMGRGFRGKCPCCGSGQLFRRFLKVADHCEACGEELHHHRADDFPAYLVIVAVGHIVVPLILAVETAYQPPYWLQALIWLPFTLVSSLALLQPTKGAIVGMQWHGGMHGFETAKTRRTTNAITELRTAAPSGAI